LKKPLICAVITDNDFGLVSGVDRFVDLYEVRLDLTGDGWQEWVKKLQRPWIAVNRLQECGGGWTGDEASRLGKLFEAVELGARIVEIELKTPDLARLVSQIHKEKAQCMISAYDLTGTPDINELKSFIRQETAAGADICKVMTSALRYEDNFTILRLLDECAGNRIVAFAEGELGVTSRVLSAMAGGYFTYASISNRPSDSGERSATYLRSLYEAVKKSQGLALD
jgi:3-dehydroquinate dehydratase I